MPHASKNDLYGLEMKEEAVDFFGVPSSGSSWDQYGLYTRQGGRECGLVFGAPEMFTLKFIILFWLFG